MTTVVSTPLADGLARARGFELRRTLTGFKFVGEQVGLLEAQGRAGDFLLGFEESCGYLAGTHVRDKDAVVACALVCRAARWWRSRGMTLGEAVDALYGELGWSRAALAGVEYPGAEGASRMASIMAALRERPPAEVAGLAVEGVVDYLAGVEMPVVRGGAGEGATVDEGECEPQILPPSDVLELRLSGGNRLIVRPSGTEPKVKAYVFSRAESAGDADALLERLRAAARELLG